MTTSMGIGLEAFSTLADGLDHPECVAWDPAAQVLYAGGEAGQLYVVRESGEVEQVADAGAFVLGLALDAEGRVYACAGSQVVRIEPGTGNVEVYSTGAPDEPMRVPNYPAFGHDGVLYVTDSGEWDGEDGLVHRVLPGGAAEVWTRELRSFPNGCCLAPSGDALLVVQSTDPGVWRVPIGPGGAAGAAEQVCTLPETVPDGVAVDSAGRLYVSCYRPDRIYRVDLDGTPEVLAEDPRGTALAAPTNVAFMGKELDRLAAANLGRWHVAVADVGATGNPPARPTIA